MAPDLELKKAFTDISILMQNTRDKVRQMQSSIDMLGRSTMGMRITNKTIQSLDPEHRTYESIGRIFVLRKQDELSKKITSYVEENEKKIKQLEENKAYHENKMKESENNLRELKMGGKHFGNLWHIRNVIYIRMSHYEQKAFPHYLQNTWNGFRRDFNSVFPYAAPPLLCAYLLYTWGNEENKRLSRKNPADYENEV
ncbi:hypothetical protein RDWZM_002704 [Blomia tropicalis]|uniref:Cytochrome b-c1 complex subunit 8 n=1 Tax=Blomia tropicalis TaxID=40697 RepID=A0A9Q0ME78_BLOTA|nr:hypothetical protein RDWZM_002704 [Blomia tropicalis]